MRRSVLASLDTPRLRIAGLALLLTFVDALKPISVDDTIFYFYARHIAEFPFDPYGFQVFWEVRPVSALDLFAPVAMPYWWALGMHVVGNAPWLWKLWMFPYAGLLVWAVDVLVRRFVGRARPGVVAMIVLGPAVLPAFNLMIDIPSLALALAAMATFVRTCEGAPLRGAFIAGLLAALALETKFTAFAPTAAIAVFAAFHRRWRLLAIFGAVAGGVFVSFETALYFAYGTSHFLHSLGIPEQAIRHNTVSGWAVGWVALAGALAGPVALLALSQFRARVGLAFCAVALACLPFLLVAAGAPPADSPPFAATSLSGGDRELVIFFVSGLLVCLALLAGLVEQVRGAPARLSPDHLFLFAWFGLELLQCFGISPFHALRRMIGPIAAGTLLVAHGASLRGRPAAAFRPAALLSIALGLLFATADVTDARARARMHDALAARLRELGCDPSRETVWFTGHWGFQFDAERRGYRPLVGGRSEVHRGDWVLLPSRSSAQPTPRIALGPPLARIEARNAFPLSTIPSAYMAAVPIRRQPRVQNRVTVYRVAESGRAPLQFYRAMPR